MKLNTKRTFRYYWKHVKRYKWLAMFILVFIALNSIVNLTVPYFYKRFFDALVGQGVVEAIAPALFLIILWIFGLNIVQWALWRGMNFANAYFQVRVMADISNECFSYLHQHSYNFFTSNFVGSLVKRVNRLVRSFEGMADQFTYNLGQLIFNVLIIFGVLFWLHPIIGVVMFGWTVFFIAVNYFFSNFKLKYDIARAKADTRISSALADTITNNTNIKLFAALSYEFERFKAITHDWFEKTRHAWNLDQIAEAVQTFLMIFLEFGIFYFAIGLWKQGILTVGDFVWIQSYLLTLFHRLWDFGRVIRQVYGHLADAEEMIVILNTPHAVRDRTKAKPISITHGKIEFKNVFFTYSKGSEVIRQLNLIIKPGEKVALIGPSGGGKSTVAKLILRLHDVWKGKILIDGQDISRVTQDSLRSQISLVPQDPILFHRSLMENIRYGNHEANEKEAIAAAKLAYCHEFISKLPKQYGTYVGERGIRLSGGERQRVAIARAILANAPVLILDEATSSLDSESELLIQEALSHLMKQKTTLVIAHRLSTIMKMDRIVVLQGGKVVEEGTHADLVAKGSGLYKKLWDLQVGGYVNK
ncbi:MAG: ABC transporter ATP-binding protein [Candidatus Peregrinibacteria bacterium]